MPTRSGDGQATITQFRTMILAFSHKQLMLVLRKEMLGRYRMGWSDERKAAAPVVSEAARETGRGRDWERLAGYCAKLHDGEDPREEKRREHVSKWW